VWEVVFGFEKLVGNLENLQKHAIEFSDAEQFRIGINLAWEKLDKYYNLLDEIPIYYIALALHLAYRWDWFEIIWEEKPDWVIKAKAIVYKMWAKDYAQLDVYTFSPSGDEENSSAKRIRFYDPFAVNDRLFQLLRSIAVIGDEYEAWQRDRESTDSGVRDPLAYWASKQDSYSRLSGMAMDSMMIQLVSAECGRVFSAAGSMVPLTRARLDAITIGICQILRFWYKAGVLPQTDLDIMPVDISHDGNSESDRNNEELQYRDDRSATSEIDSE
jgi:hypothetical protein